ncbi:MAG: S41 family peptidase [Candidatus Sericytochromatia bacterium]|nr:S41 family peptidase [Candidatus Sericytochromatia bacterium]
MIKSSLKQKSLVVALMLTSFTAGLNLQPLIAKAEGSGFGIFLKAYDILNSEYIGNIDNEKLVQGAIRGMMESTGDPYTRYMDPKAYQGMKEERVGNFSGIGIQIGVRKNMFNGHEMTNLTVISPLEDTPAWKAGILAGDIILEIDGKTTNNVAIDQAVNMIKGLKGTPVKLKIYRESTKKMFDSQIVRDSIVTKIVKSRMLENHIGYVRLSTFMSNDAPKEVKAAIDKLKSKSMKALVFDLRGNPGGLLPNAVSIGSMFVPKGPIVQIVDKEGKKEYLNATGELEVPMNLPVVLLVDEGSASASEIVSGALKDNKRATLIGTKTFGKGLVQTVHELDDGSGMAITTNKYLTSNGIDINKKGIEPNIFVELPKNMVPESPDSSVVSKNDTQLRRALSFLKEKLAKKDTPKKEG